ncbi:hypothetical protein J4Q44_G00182190 [Coregonus suidteri]|uniref:Pentraxin (PTX) domain-containing protein n=1 Tax=Coregonus suidteri TaxID=861788 RepID=A0AAN8LJB0_9TELE
MPSLRAGRRALALILLVVLQLQACRGQGAAELRKPIYQRLRRLDDQFRRFQELTLSRLEFLSQMSNVSTSLEVRVQTQSDQHRNLTQELTQLRDTTTQELNGLKDWSSKLQKKNKRMEGRLASLERRRQGQSSRQTQRRSQEQGESLSSLTLALHSQEGRLHSLEAQREELLVGLRGLQESLREQDLRMSRLEGRLGELLQGNGVSSRGSERTGDPLTSNLTPQDTVPPRRTQASRGQSPRQDTQTQPGHTQTYYQPLPQANIQPQPQPQTFSQPQPRPSPSPNPNPTLSQNTPKTGGRGQDYSLHIHLPTPHSLLLSPRRRRGGWGREDRIAPGLVVLNRGQNHICNVDSMFLFPSASSENYVTFSQSFPALPELSVCLWLRVDVGRATLDFVVGDPAYRELPVDSVLDGCWHHLCVLWSSIQGRFWHYTDRRLTSAGSRFRKGYEVPAGGSVVLGAEQDSQGGGFDPTEGFVGRLAGFTVWDRVLSPGEVTGVATGRGVPRGVVLGLGDVDGVHGGVQRVACECLEHCS